MAVNKKNFLKFADGAIALAEAVKKDIQKDGMISTKTILVLNDFIIAANEVNDNIESVRDPNQRLN